MSKGKHLHWHLLLTKLQTLYFTSFSTNILFLVHNTIQDPTPRLVILSPWSPPICEFLSLSLLFTTSTHLESTHQVLCKKSLDLGLSDVFSLLDWGYGLWGEDHGDGVPSLSPEVPDAHMTSQGILTLIIG